MSGAQPCRHCGALIVLRPLLNGNVRPFDRKLLPADEIAESVRYVPAQRDGQLVMVPASDLADRRLVGVRWFVALHTCAAGLRARREKYTVGGFADVAEQLAAVWGSPSSAAPPAPRTPAPRGRLTATAEP